ncbi:neutral zinc metallopeptidase [Kribbella sp. NPDC051952]|uniref:neutral zinc metallopeptidase n=1 Tax=Kribbella sp. NPDC051952 TaxID=3154851 RepID=UPI00341A9237
MIDRHLLYNPLYDAGRVAADGCSLPTARLATGKAMVRYATAFTQCLNKAWAPVIERAGFEFRPPAAVHPAPTGTESVCGVMDEDVGAFYCDTDLGIYFNWPSYAVPGASQEGIGASVQYLIAHEYGHHVQFLTGISDSYDDRYSAAANDAARQVDQNRSEMQAHCFATAFFGANRRTLRIRGERLAHYGHIGYDRSEKDMVNFDRWLRQGFTKGPGGCGTWAASAGEVS